MAEEESLQLVRSLLPEEWVIHEYKPDYGIDNVVEIFRYVDGEREIAETLRIFLYSGKGYHLCGLGQFLSIRERTWKNLIARWVIVNQ